MNPLFFLPMIMTVFGGVQQYKAGKEMEQMAAQQEKLAHENKALAEAELEEGIKRQERKDKMLRGSAKARAAASGARVSGSVEGYLDFMEDVQTDDIAWMRKAGMSRARMDLSAGLLQAQQTRLSGKQQKYSAYSSIGQLGLYGAQAGLFGGGGFTPSGTGASGFGIKF